ncbi:Open rectifier potassium channel protein 1 [Amphibalanus amphitrite]|uniref:Open rectifier potassium channel protein 1 n=1 Tax=Amphibalanus amphitrite TaxID=1232801 RepID=A0A6A4WHE6_AMPAM|nr:Open rectifier potassium channel protein 1 [Amphibalanus amphitrite]
MSQESAVASSALDMRLIPEFDGGNASVEEWLDKTELVCQLRGVSDIQTVVPLRLTGGAFSVYQQLKPEEKLQYSAVKAALLRAFAVDKFQAYEEFTARRLRVGESVDVYLADLRRLASLFGGLGDTALMTRRGTLPGTDAGKRVRRGGVCANLLSGSPRVRGALPTVQLLVNGQRRVAVIDSGCSCTIIHESCCASWRRCGVTVMAVNGSRLPSSGVTEVAVQLKSGGPAVTLSAVVVPDKPLGVDMLVGMTGIAALGGVTVRAADDVVFGASERPDVAVPGPGGVPPRCSAVTPPALTVEERDFTNRSDTLTRVPSLWLRQDSQPADQRPSDGQPVAAAAVVGSEVGDGGGAVTVDFRQAVTDVHVRAGHPGVRRTLYFARRDVSSSISRKVVREVVTACDVCRAVDPAPVTWRHGSLAVEGTWDRLAIDVTHYGGQSYLSVIDCGPSRFCVWRLLRRSDAATVTSELEQVFAERGAPAELLADNDTAFRSRQFAAFAARWGVLLRFRAVHRPSGNSIVERNHRSVKVIAARKKCGIGEAVHLYNITPRDGGTAAEAPANGIYRYPVRDAVRQRATAGASEEAVIGRPPARREGDFQVGDAVWVRRPGTRCTERSVRGTVSGVVSPQVVEVGGVPWHIRDLRHCGDTGGPAAGPRTPDRGSGGPQEAEEDRAGSPIVMTFGYEGDGAPGRPVEEADDAGGECGRSESDSGERVVRRGQRNRRPPDFFGHVVPIDALNSSSGSDDLEDQGAWAFIQLELPAEEQRFALKKVRAADVEDAYNYMSSLFWHYQGKNMTFVQWDRKAYNYDGTVNDWNYDWTFPKSLLFTITIMTTIGYGHISPVTFAGQMFTICYAMIGTPLLLVYLANVGDTMASAFTLTYSRRYHSEAGFGKKVKRLANDKVGSESYMPTNEVMVPITINMVLIVFYLMMGAVIFSNWEGWDIGSSCYFSFVTLSTIGFGDMVPGNSFLDYKDGASAAFKMMVTILYCIFGMALISMCIQMMQDQIVAKVHWFAAEVGIIESQKKTDSRIKYKRSRDPSIPETSLADDGAPAGGEKRRKKKKRRDQDREESKKRREEAEEAPPAAEAAPRPVSARVINSRPASAAGPPPVEQPERVAATDRLIDEEMGVA